MDVEEDAGGAGAATNGNELQFGMSVPVSSLFARQASLHYAVALQKQRRLDILGQSGPISLLWDMEDRLQEHSYYLGLPAHLLLRVFAFLPVLSIFHLRLVCKVWNSLLRSPWLLNTWVPSYPNQEAWLVVGSIALTPTPLFAFRFLSYSPSLQHWFHLPLDSATSPRIDAMLGSSSCFLGPKFLTEHFLYHPRVCVDNAIVADSDGGLICFVIDDRPFAHRAFTIPRRSHTRPRSVHFDATPFSSGHVSIVVLNPLTGAVKQLPPPPDLDVTFGDFKEFSIAMCSQGGAHADYHVILSELGKDFINSFHVYSSSTNTWKVAQGESSYKELCGRVDDVLDADFFRTMSSRALKGYNIKRDQWSVIEVTSPEVQCFDIRGFKWNGDLYSAKKWTTRSEEERLIIGFSVFRFQSASDTVGRWVEISRTPPCLVLLTTMREERSCRLKMLASQNLVCMQAMHICKKGEFLPPLIYNLFSNRWCRVPPYNGSYSFENLFVFTPRLDAAV